jgi:hypothetical protein
VIPRIPRPMRHECSCGARLTWESRETPKGKRWLALCANPACGEFRTNLGDGPEPEDGLRVFLLGDTPVVRDIKPWNRLFFRAAVLGYSWRSSDESCSSCGQELTSALELPWRYDRASDPTGVQICIPCGATIVRFWANGEWSTVSLDANAWEEPAPVIQLLKRTLAERAHRPPTWDFE